MGKEPGHIIDAAAFRVPRRDRRRGRRYNLPANLAARQVAANGQRIAFAPTEAKTRGATTLTTATLTFQAQAVNRPPQAPFLPEIVAAEANVPAVDRMLGTSAATEVEFDTRYLSDGFYDPGADNADLGGAANKAELFLKN